MSALGRMVSGLLLAIGFAAADDGAGAAETYSRMTLTEPDRSVAAIAFSPDGERIAIALDDRTARVKKTNGADEGVLLTWQGGLAYLAAFSADGTRLVLATEDFALRVWDVAAAREMTVMQAPRHQLRAVAFSPDGTKLVTAGEDGSVRIWDVGGGSRAGAVLGGHAQAVTDAAFSPDGTRIVTASRDKTARLWDAASGRQLAVFAHPSAVLSAAFSADGLRLVTGSHDEAAHVFDIASGREIAVLKGHTGDVLDANFSRDGTRIVTGSNDDTARIWDAATRQPIAVLEGHLAEVFSAAFSPDGQRVLTAGRDATGRIWTKVPDMKMPDGAAGLWHHNMTAPDPMPDELVRYMCLANPFNIHANGLVVSFMGSTETEPPEALLHLRCAQDLTCQIFGGPPAQGLEPQGEARLSFSGDGGELCLAGECQSISRCPALSWSEAERNSGFAAAWEAKVLAPME